MCECVCSGFVSLRVCVVVLYSSSGASKFFSTIMKRNIATKSCMNFVIATKPIEGEYNIPLDCQI